ncbi:MAG: dihydropteroate synthase [Lachnospiraceae bacterium]|nr:dihydropteroate synthase [Lachnospiraceae bacterium]
MRIGNREFDVKNHTYVFGILNVTPDSFSDGGKWNGTDAALRHVEEMLKQGMDIVDVGGESTRPGYQMISEQEEIERVLPVIEAVKARFDVPISLDTYKAGVAEAGLNAGVDLINDIWGLKYDQKMAEVIASHNAACCLMHNREKAEYQDFMPDVLGDLKETLSLASNAGIRNEQIILDPGVGFGKTYEQNLEVIARMDELNCFGLPILLGTSRKSVIGLTLDLPKDQREEGTLATTVLAVMKHVAFVRVHDVEKNVRAIRMAEAIRERSVR